MLAWHSDLDFLSHFLWNICDINIGKPLLSRSYMEASRISIFVKSKYVFVLSGRGGRAGLVGVQRQVCGEF